MQLFAREFVALAGAASRVPESRRRRMAKLAVARHNSILRPALLKFQLIDRPEV